MKRRQNGEKRFLWSHCCASCGVAVGSRFCLRWSERKWVRFRIIIPFNSTFPFADRRGLMPLILTRFQSQSHKANKCDCEQKQTNNQRNVVLPSLSNTLTTPNIMNAIGFYLRKQNLLIELYKAVPETTDAFSKRLIAPNIDFSVFLFRPLYTRFLFRNV